MNGQTDKHTENLPILQDFIHYQGRYPIQNQTNFSPSTPYVLRGPTSPIWDYGGPHQNPPNKNDYP